MNKKTLAIAVLGILLISVAISYYNYSIEKEVSEYATTSYNFYITNCAKHIPKQNCQELLIGLPITKPEMQQMNG